MYLGLPDIARILPSSLEYKHFVSPAQQSTRATIFVRVTLSRPSRMHTRENQAAAMPTEEEMKEPPAQVESWGTDGQGRAKAGPPTTAFLQNPLAHMSNAEIIADADVFVEANGLVEYRDVFRKGGLLAKTHNQADGFEKLTELTDDDKGVLRFEARNHWKSSPRKLYFLCALCAGCAIVQGMDQTVINGAQVGDPGGQRTRPETTNGI